MGRSCITWKQFSSQALFSLICSLPLVLYIVMQYFPCTKCGISFSHLPFWLKRESYCHSLCTSSRISPMLSVLILLYFREIKRIRKAITFVYSAFQFALSGLILLSILSRENRSYYPHFKDEKSEIQQWAPSSPTRNVQGWILTWAFGLCSFQNTVLPPCAQCLL